jgi:Asp/Glu/hydantoin racemase
VLQSINVKTLLLWATNDAISPLTVGEHLSSLIPRSRLHSFESDDHWVAREYAPEVAAAIVELATPTLGFLHTAEVHVGTFDDLVEASRHQNPSEPNVATVHLVSEELLARARTHGIADPALANNLLASLQDLVEHDVDLIVCTCSTISGLAEDLGATLSVPVVRSDRPMASTAVTVGDSIAVVAAVESTIKPTMQLLREEADRQGTNPELTSLPCLDAWVLFEAGDIDAYHRMIAAHVEKLRDHVDVVVLAQASMLGALQFIDATSDGALVLVSPPPAVATAVALLRH